PGGRAVGWVAQSAEAKAAGVYATFLGRAEPMGDGCLRVMKRFWNWMGDASRVSITGVAINLDKVQPLPRTLSEDGDPNRQFDPKRDLRKKSPRRSNWGERWKSRDRARFRVGPSR